MEERNAAIVHGTITDIHPCKGGNMVDIAVTGVENVPQLPNFIPDQTENLSFFVNDRVREVFEVGGVKTVKVTKWAERFTLRY